MKTKTYALVVIATVACAHAATASDWPQWLGPKRDNISTETGLLKQWPKEGPRLAWKVDTVGEGYSAPAIANGRIYLLGMFKDEECAVCLNEKDGSEIWKVRIGAVGVNPKTFYYPGPRGTPTIVGDKLYALGSAGDLVCLDVGKGDKVWSKDLVKDFAGKPGQWVYSESPLVDGDLVIVSPGGAEATVVALNKNDGKVAWKTALKEADKAAYGSPIQIEVGGARQYVVYLSKGLVGLAAADGKFLWRFDKVAAKNGINIPTPVYHDGLIVVSNGYNTGSGAAKLSKEDDKLTATEVWFEKKIQSQIGGFFRVGNYLYGSAGNKLMCLEFATGKALWDDRSVSPASVTVADGMLYVRGHEGSGEVALVELDPKGYKEQGRFSQPERSSKKAWPYPVVANGHLYLRDQGELLCYDVRAGGKK